MSETNIVSINSLSSKTGHPSFNPIIPLPADMSSLSKKYQEIQESLTSLASGLVNKNTDNLNVLHLSNQLGGKIVIYRIKSISIVDSNNNFVITGDYYETGFKHGDSPILRDIKFRGSKVDDIVH